MKKMNRRDYLKGMGAAAGVIAGTELNALGQHHAQTSASSTRAQQEARSRETASDAQTVVRELDLLSTADVTLVFHGLMAIWQQPSKEWVVGFHSKKSGNHEHKLMVRAYQKTAPGQCTQLGDPDPEKALVPPGGPLDLKIIDPRILDGVYFFQPPPNGLEKHDNDFRWVVDLESREWYGPNVPRNTVHDPVLTVTHGLFYTLMKTLSTFRRQKSDGEDARYIGSIAEYVGANIYLKTGGKIILTLPKQTITITQAPDVSYEVHFMNTCFKKGTNEACKFKPYNPNKPLRNDFYMHFDGINLSADRELELVVARGVKGNGPVICGAARASDESPCSAVGYGGPKGFPVFP
jgi:hypothetical protein